MRAKAPRIRVTSRRKMKAANRLMNEIGVQKAQAVKRAMEKVEEVVQEPDDGWTEEKIKQMIKEVTKK